ncbi:MAG TPA: [acyl-carrier-protein] S-malonyltransferase [Candidatus Omnitrophica bacterium]|nr:[acyl-carrier-protein] S-malonyltransferase [Candidatus Omnitrophota bacterium]
MKLAYIFPGQGAQFIGMGKDLYDNSPDARRIFEEADTILNLPLSKMCFEGPFEELTKTRNCQPAIVAVSMAALFVFRKTYPQFIPSYVAGLSLGEYSALVAADIVNFHDALHLVRKRGEFMEAAAAKNPGKMSCILGMDVKAVEEICSVTGAQIANLNCPGQVVVSGTNAQLEALASKATEAGAKRVISLDVSGAFHCSLMKDAAVKLKAEIDKVHFNKARYPLISNVDAKEQTDPHVIKENLIKQVDSATYWEASMRHLVAGGVRQYFEIGPGTVLKGLFKKIDTAVQVISAGKWPDIQEIGKNLA